LFYFTCLKNSIKAKYGPSCVIVGPQRTTVYIPEYPPRDIKVHTFSHEMHVHGAKATFVFTKAMKKIILKGFDQPNLNMLFSMIF